MQGLQGHSRVLVEAGKATGGGAQAPQHALTPTRRPRLRLPRCAGAQSQPEALREQLEALLAANGVAYGYSKTSKFANFIRKTLD
jgi:hypothetical protein